MPRLRSNESPSALDVTMAQRLELNYLIYNDPLGYADLILNGDPEEYLKNVAGSHGLEIRMNAGHYRFFALVMSGICCLVLPDQF